MPTSTVDTTNEQPATDVTTTTEPTPPMPEPPAQPQAEIKVDDWVAIKDQTVLGWDWHGNVKSIEGDMVSLLWKEFDVCECGYNKNELVLIAAPA